MITIRLAGWISAIWKDSEIAIGYGYPKTAFKRELDTDKDIRNAILAISRIQTIGKSCTFHNRLFSIFHSIFSAFYVISPNLSVTL